MNGSKFDWNLNKHECINYNKKSKMSEFCLKENRKTLATASYRHYVLLLTVNYHFCLIYHFCLDGYAK